MDTPEFSSVAATTGQPPILARQRLGAPQRDAARMAENAAEQPATRHARAHEEKIARDAENYPPGKGLPRGPILEERLHGEELDREK